MSTIDQRIVQMRFDNKDFESNVGTTMSTLEKLKEKLKFTRSDEGIRNLKNSFNGFDFSGMQVGIDSINNKFSALGIAGMEVIRRLTNAAIDMGEKLAKAITIDPIKDGFAEYELKMNSIQTILMGARTREGLPVTLDMVNEKLNELNTYADKTIYSFSDMTSNIGKFTNAGVSLEDSVAAIQGVANVAALSGANAQQASHAMYNFAQALSSGSVKLIDWKSIENANMATVEFKQTLIDTGLALGTLVEKDGKYVTTTTDLQGKVSEAFDATSNFNNSLAHQWMTTDVLTEALAKYSDETTDLGKKAYQAATQVKTFHQLIDTVKESLGSGWAQTFEYIVGDFEEARNLWTDVNNEINKVLDPIAEARNEMFKFWHDNGGRDAMIEAVSTLWQGLKGVTGTIKEIGDNAFERMFGKIDGQALVNVTKSIRDFFKNFTVSNAFTEAATTLLESFFQVIESGVGALQRAGRFVSMFWEAIEPGRELLYNLATSVGEVISTIVSMASRLANVFENNGGLRALANGFANIFNGLLTVIAPIFTKINEFVSNLAGSPMIQKAGEKLAEIAKGFEYLTQSIDFAGIAETVSTALGKIWEILSKIGTAIKPFTDAIGDFVLGIFGIGNGAEDSGTKLDKFKSGVDNVKEALSDLKGKAVQWFLDHAPAGLIDDISTALSKLESFLQPIWDKIDSIKQSFQDGTWYEDFKGWLDSIVTKLNELRVATQGFVKDKVVLAFTKTWEGIGKAFEHFVNALKAGWGFVVNVIHSLFGTDLYTAIKRIFSIITGWAGVKAVLNIKNMTDALRSFSNLGDNLKKLGDALGNAGKGFSESLFAPFKAFFTKAKAEALRDVAIAIGVLAGSLIALTFVDFNALQSAVLVIGELMTMLAAFYYAMNKITKTSGNTGLMGILFGSSGFSFGNNDFIKLAAAILILTGSLVALSKVEFDDLAKGLIAVGILMLELTFFTKQVAGLDKAAKGMIGIAVAVGVLTLSVKSLAKLDVEGLLIGLGAMALLLIELSAFLHDMQDVSTKGFGGVIVLAAGVGVLTLSVKALAALDLAELVKGLGGLVVMLIELGVFLKTMENISTKGFAGVIVLAIGLRTLTSSVSALGSLDFETLLKGLGGVAILLIELTAFMHDMQGISGVTAAAAAAMVIMAAALRILAVSVKALGNMSTGSMIQGLAGVAAEMLIFVAACKLLDGVSPMILVASAAMVVMSAAVLLLVPAIKLLGSMDFWSLVKGISAVAAVFLVFGAAGAILGPLSIGMLAAAAAIGVMSVAIWLLVPAVTALGSMPLANIGKAILALAGVFVIFGAAGALLGPLAPGMFAAAGGILALSAASAAAGASMLVVAAGLTAMGKAVMVVMDSILALLQSILGGLPFIGDDIDAWFTDRRKALKTELDPKEATQTGKDWVKGVGDGVNSEKANLKSEADGVGDVVKESLGTVAATAKQSGSDTGAGFLEGLDMSDIKGMMTGDTEALTGTMKNMMSDGGMDAGTMLGDGMLEGFDMSNPSTSIESMLGSDMGGLEDMMGEYGFNAGDKWSASVSEGVSHGAPGIHLTVGNETRFLSETALEHYKNIGFITGKEYDAAIASEIENGSANIVLSTELALTRLEGIDITKPGATVGDSFLEGIKSKSSKLRQTVSEDLGKEAETGLEDTKEYFTDAGEGSADEFAMALMDQSMGVVPDAAEAVGESASGELKNAEDDAYDAGRDFGYGFADGTSRTSGYVKNAARELAAEALRSMASELDINSPSKEAMKLGRFGGMGLGVGFKNATGYVKAQATTLADKGLYAMQSVMERLRDSLNFDTDLDPVISPVLDLQQIQNGMTTMGSMLGSRQFAVAGAYGMDPYAFQSIRAVTSASDRAPSSNADVVSAVGALQDEIATLKSAMEQMKFEADGRVIGQVAYKEVDRRLGNTFVRNRREGRG